VTGFTIRTARSSLAVLITASCFVSCARRDASFHCDPVGRQRGTFVSSQYSVEPDLRSVPKVAGLVHDVFGDPIEGVLVEVYPFTLPEDRVLPQYLYEHSGRIAACATTLRGRFSFDHLSPGRYEVRVSGPTNEYGVESLTVEVVRANSTRRQNYTRFLKVTVGHAL